MPFGPDECRSVSKGRLDFCFRNDQIELEDLHLELRETSSKLRTSCHAPVYIQNCTSSLISCRQNCLPRAVPCSFHPSLSRIRMSHERLKLAGRGRSKTVCSMPCLPQKNEFISGFQRSGAPTFQGVERCIQTNES